LVQEDGAIHRVVSYHPDPAKQALLDRLAKITPPDRAPEAVRAAIATGQPQRKDLTGEFLYTQVAEPECGAVLRQIGATGLIVAPLCLRGRVVGALRLTMAESGRCYSDDDLALAQEVANHASLALEEARLYRVAQAAINARDNLLAAVTHDVRNYLTTISVAADFLLSFPEARDRRRGRKQLDSVHHAVQRLKVLVNSLRDATMIETGHFTIVPRREEVSTLLHEALRSFEPQAEHRALRLRARPGDGLLAVRCDRERIIQVIGNLLSNAIKFTASGGEISIEARQLNDSVHFCVADTGKGIPVDEIAHVFERHWRGRQDRHQGTGLGLFIARGIVEAHGGKIWVESVAGGGSMFYFTLPALPPCSQETAPADGRLTNRPFSDSPA
jgi:signal transduction histidine kinase